MYPSDRAHSKLGHLEGRMCKHGKHRSMHAAHELSLVRAIKCLTRWRLHDPKYMCCTHLKHWKLYFMHPFHSTQLLDIVHGTNHNTVRRINLAGTVSIKSLSVFGSKPWDYLSVVCGSSVLVFTGYQRDFDATHSRTSSPLPFLLTQPSAVER